MDVYTLVKKSHLCIISIGTFSAHRTDNGSHQLDIITCCCVAIKQDFVWSPYTQDENYTAIAHTSMWQRIHIFVWNFSSQLHGCTMHNVSLMYNKQKITSSSHGEGRNQGLSTNIHFCFLLQILGVLYSELLGTRILPGLIIAPNACWNATFIIWSLMLPRLTSFDDSAACKCTIGRNVASKTNFTARSGV